MGSRAVSSVCWTILVIFTTISVSDIFFYFDIQFPKFYCYTYLMLRNALAIQVILHLDSIVIIRYIFIFLLKNPMNFQDDFWCLFINLWVVVVRFYNEMNTFSKLSNCKITKKVNEEFQQKLFLVSINYGLCYLP